MHKPCINRGGCINIHDEGGHLDRRTRQVAESIDRMVDSLQSMRRALPELERRTRFQAGGDGYPALSMGGGGGAGGIGRPTERAALTRPVSDPVRKWTRDALEQLQAAARAIEVADGRRRLVLGSGPAPEPDRCVVCDEPENPAAPLRNDRCPKDYQYRRRHGVDRGARATA